MRKPKPFAKPLYFTRPLLPDLNEYNRRLSQIWKSQWLSNFGKQHQELEKKLKIYLGHEQLVVMNNGTQALVLACKALELTGEVITTPFTFPATVHALSWNNLTPVFCDIDPETLTLDPAKIRAAITDKTSAIMGVHVYGIPCHVKEIARIAKEYKLKVIYDAAHAFGTQIDGTPIAAFGDITMFSFHPTKLFHTGEGGGLACRSRAIFKQATLLRNFGIVDEETVSSIGINAKLGEMQAALGIETLKLVTTERKKRKILFDHYQKRLAQIPGISLILTPQNVVPSYQYCVIRVDKKKYGKSRDQLHSLFREHNVITRKYFQPLCSNYTHYKELPSAKIENLPIANAAVKEVLVLPFYGTLSLQTVDRVCDMIEYWATV